MHNQFSELETANVLVESLCIGSESKFQVNITVKNIFYGYLFFPNKQCMFFISNREEKNILFSN